LADEGQGVVWVALVDECFDFSGHRECEPFFALRCEREGAALAVPVLRADANGRPGSDGHVAAKQEPETQMGGCRCEQRGAFVVGDCDVSRARHWVTPYGGVQFGCAVVLPEPAEDLTQGFAVVAPGERGAVAKARVYFNDVRGTDFLGWKGTTFRDEGFGDRRAVGVFGFRAEETGAEDFGQ